jgi:hypothetical protein
MTTLEFSIPKKVIISTKDPTMNTSHQMTRRGLERDNTFLKTSK